MIKLINIFYTDTNTQSHSYEETNPKTVREPGKDGAFLVCVSWIFCALFPTHREIAGWAAVFSSHWPEEEVGAPTILDLSRFFLKPEACQATGGGVVSWPNCCWLV